MYCINYDFFIIKYIFKYKINVQYLTSITWKLSEKKVSESLIYFNKSYTIIIRLNFILIFENNYKFYLSKH